MGGLGCSRTQGIMEYWPPARRAYGSERKMEYWGVKAVADLILLFALCHPNKKNLIPPNTCFQYSNIPIFHHSTA
jgi:hypothetical protein